jgi:hypothetical protein
MTEDYKCMDCIFAEEVEDEDYMACQARQKLVMPFDEVCDYFDLNGCVCKECTMDKYSNSTSDNFFTNLAKIDDTNCNANSYSKKNPEYEELLPCTCDECVKEFIESIEPLELDENSTQLDFMLDDFVTSTDEVTDALAFLDEGTTNEDVLSALLGLEATIAVLKRYLLDRNEALTPLPPCDCAACKAVDKRRK